MYMYSFIHLFFYFKAKVEHWKELCFDLDVVVKEGHLMLQQKSSGKAVAFEEQLGNMNEDWNTVIQDVQEKKKHIEKTAKKWWDFTRNKLKMIRWLNKKETDADFQGSKSCSLDSAQEQMNRYKVSETTKSYLVLFVQRSFLRTSKIYDTNNTRRS